MKGRETLERRTLDEFIDNWRTNYLVRTKSLPLFKNGVGERMSPLQRDLLIEGRIYRPSLGNLRIGLTNWMLVHTDMATVATAAFEFANNIDRLNLERLADEIRVPLGDLAFYAKRLDEERVQEITSRLRTPWTDSTSLVTEPFGVVASHGYSVWRNVSETIFPSPD